MQAAKHLRKTEPHLYLRRWQAKFGGMEVSEPQRLRSQEEKPSEGDSLLQAARRLRLSKIDV